MGRLGLASAGILVAAALAPLALAGSPLEDCTVLRYSILPNLGGAVRVCPDDLDYEIGGLLPELPGLDGGDDNAIDFVATPCAGDKSGVMIEVNGKPSFVCIGLEVVPPSHVPLPGLGDGSIDLVACPTGTGAVVEAGLATIGLCAIITFGPSPSDEPFVDTSDEHCQGGHDPAVGVGGVFVALCLYPFLAIGTPGGPGEPPSIGIDLSPCSSSGIDPAITVGDGGVYFCVEAMVDP